MNAARALSVVAICVLASSPIPAAHAQVNPTAMVSGTTQVSITAGTFSTTLYTVPADKRLVLTDFNYSFTFISSSITITSLMELREGSTPRWTWRVLQSVSPFVAIWPVEKNFTTGLVFGPGSQVILRQVVGGNSSNDCSISWSGYLTPLTTTAMETPIDARPEGLSVVPNPAGSFASIRFHLNTSQDVLLAIYDVAGRKIRTVYEGRIREGDHALNWDGRDDRNRPVADGAYFARLESPSFVASKKIIQAP